LRRKTRLITKKEKIMNYIWAFIVGGVLCVIAQILLDKTRLSPARILVGYVVGGVILGAVGLYPKLVEFAGAGAAVPLSGFGNLIAEGVRKAVDEKGLLGALSGALTAAAAGTAAALCFGFIASLIFHGKNK
jgi:stage V sporulation protein AE